jgi:hypothetical protein
MTTSFPNPYEILNNKLDRLYSILANGEQAKNQNEYFGIKAASEFIDKTENALRQMAFLKQIKHIKKGGKLYFSKLDLIEYLESGRVEIERVNAVDVLKTKNS